MNPFLMLAGKDASWEQPAPEPIWSYFRVSYSPSARWDRSMSSYGATPSELRHPVELAFTRWRVRG